MTKKRKLLIAALFLLACMSAGIVFLGTHGSIGACSRDYPALEVEETSAVDFFPTDYQSARTRFLDALGERRPRAEHLQNARLVL